MKRFVETLEATSGYHAQKTCGRQLHIFKALYDVAEKYVEVRARADGRGMAGDAGSGLEVDLGSVGGPGTGFIPGYMPRGNTDGMGLGDGLGMGLQTAIGNRDVEMDLEGAQLWEWFSKNQSFMRMLDDM